MTLEEMGKEFVEEWDRHHTVNKEGDSCWICDGEKDNQVIALHWFITGRRKGQEEIDKLTNERDYY